MQLDVNFSNSPVIRRLMLSSGKTPFLVGFYLFIFCPLWFLGKLLSWSKFFICSPFYESLYISFGLTFWCCWPMNEKEGSCAVGVVFFLLAQPIKYFDPQQQKGFCVMCWVCAWVLFPILTSVIFFFHQENCLVLASFSLLGSVFGDVICYADTFFCFPN